VAGPATRSTSTTWRRRSRTWAGSELRACESLVVQILRHLAKLAAGGRPQPHAGWRRAATAFRLSLARRLTPAIRGRLEAGYAGLWRDAARLAAADFAADEPDFTPTPPAEPPFSLDEVLDLDWWPGGEG